MEFAALSSPLRVAVINCEDAEKWSDHVQVLQTAYGRAGDEWVEYEPGDVDMTFVRGDPVCVGIAPG